MSARKAQAPPAARPAAGARGISIDPRHALLASSMALFVARVLIPSESALDDIAGMFFVMAWFIVTALAAFVGWRTNDSAWRLTGIDFTALALAGWFGVSGFIATQSAAPRPAINGAWLWASFALSLVVMRRLIQTDGERRAVLVVVASLACTLGVLGIEQFTIELPATRRAYFANPDEALKSLNLSAPAGSRERLLFEQRLQSSEPFATFALANSLAGFLAPWLIASLAAAWQASRDSITPKWRWLGPLIGCVPIAVCLLLTKSRTAYLAAAAGAVTWFILQPAALRLFRPRWILAGGAILAVAIGIGVAAGALDREVITEAGKSLGYRGQYWIAAAEMTADHPLFGVGPGQFQSEYTRYKAVTASEVVADPHNFLLEIAAAAGLPALALLIAIGWFAWCALASQSPSVEGTLAGARWSIAGGLFGFVLAFPVGLLAYSAPSPTVYLVALPAMLGGLALWHVWGTSGTFDTRIAAIGVFVLLVNLLAAGGIGIPAVAGSLWVLLALAAPALSSTPATNARAYAAAVGLGVSGCMIACYFTCYRPMTEAQAARQSAEQSPRRTEEFLLQAAAADPRSSAAWRDLAGWRFLRWQNAPTPSNWQSVLDAQQQELRLVPHSAVAWHQAGLKRLAAYNQSQDATMLTAAIEALEKAIELYPNLAASRADLAGALLKAGQPSEAKLQAARAIELDDVTPHDDLKLKERRAEVERIAAGI